MPNIKRLERLVLVLKRVRSDPKKRRDFDLFNWATETPDCGTHMCACGWGATDVSLKRQGLRLIKAFGGLQISFKGRRGWGAVQEFFDLHDDEADFLFSSMRYKSNTAMTPVIKRIEKFIADNR